MNIRVSTPSDVKLPWYDHSTLAAVSDCPRYGIITYRHNKHLYNSKKSDALLGGNAAHKFFAAYDIYGSDKSISHAFTAEQLEQFYSAAEASEDIGRRITFALEAIYCHMDGLPDTESRKNAEKIEDSCLFWAEQQKHDRKIIGVENKFSITVDEKFRYVGLIDCLQLTKRNVLIPIERKTASRIDDKYIAKWELSRQITGYHVALNTYQKSGLLPYKLADYVEIEAQQFPMTKGDKTLRYIKQKYDREQWHYNEWYNWVIENIRRTECDTPYDAPTREACYNFNSICPLLKEFCSFDPETREEIFNEHMITSVWDPTA